MFKSPTSVLSNDNFPKKEKVERFHWADERVGFSVRSKETTLLFLWRRSYFL